MILSKMFPSFETSTNVQPTETTEVPLCLERVAFFNELCRFTWCVLNGSGRSVAV